LAPLAKNQIAPQHGISYYPKHCFLLELGVNPGINDWPLPNRQTPEYRAAGDAGELLL